MNEASEVTITPNILQVYDNVSAQTLTLPFFSMQYTVDVPGLGDVGLSYAVPELSTLQMVKITP